MKHRVHVKRKVQRYRNRHLAIKGNPLFGQRVTRAKKGKGSYKRICLKQTDYLQSLLGIQKALPIIGIKLSLA